MALLLIAIYLFGFGYSLQTFMHIYSQDEGLQKHTSRYKFLAMFCFALAWPIFWFTVLRKAK